MGPQPPRTQHAAVPSVLLVSDPGPFTNRLMDDESLPFAVRLIANENIESIKVVSRYKPPYSAAVTKTDVLDAEWPRGVISLSHIAVPFPPDDPLYGRFRPADDDQLFLGQPDIRGERGLLKISGDWLLRIRYNPFYSVLESRLLEWLDTLDNRNLPP